MNDTNMKKMRKKKFVCRPSRVRRINHVFEIEVHRICCLQSYLS